jgi:uncharacterized membrane protein YhaH (DUF805 family)
MTFGQAIELGFRRYADFRGRSSRAEYWYWVLFYFLLSLVLNVLDTAVFLRGPGEPGPFGSIATIVMLVPSIAVSARRLHDIGRTAWWLLIAFLPVIGFIVLLIWFCTRGDNGPNHYGDDPQTATGATAYALR